jgi:UDP-3-O-[3-hydroxymyristoyl] glucosamine N-acyltransferase
VKLLLSEIARLTGGDLRGEGSLTIEGAAGLREAGEKDISFLGNAKYAPLLKTTRAGAVFLSPDVPSDGRPAVVMTNPMAGWARVLEILDRERSRRPRGIHPTAVVAPTARLGAGVALGPYVVVEDEAVIGDNTVVGAQGYVGFRSRLGRDCFLHPRVTVRENCVIGDRCIFQPGVVIGCDGFGFTFHEGRHLKIPQAGGVTIGDDVEIQANTTVDRAAVGMTTIGRGVKVDNLAQIAHNVEIGDHSLIVAQCGIAGSAKIGSYVTMAAQAGVAGHLTVGDRAMVGAKAGVTRDVKPGATVWGLPAQPLKDELRMQAVLRRLPAVWDELKAIKKKLSL